MKIEAQRRLKAFKTNRLKKTEFNLKHHRTPEGAKAIAMIDGYDIFMLRNLYETIYTIRHGEKDIGYASVENSIRSRPNRVDYSVIDRNYLGKGLGLMLHEFLLSKYGILSSDDSLSVGASRLWAKLVKKHKGVIVIPSWDDHPRYTVKIRGWVEHKGFVWPTVLHNGELVPVYSINRTQDQRDALKYFYYEVRK